MKLLIVGLALFSVSAGALAQNGTIKIINSIPNGIQTNTIAFGGASGGILYSSGTYYFEVLTAPSNVTTVDASLQDLLSAPWSDTGVGATNIVLTGEIRGGGTANFWPQNTEQSFIVVGWSANEGSSWLDIETKLSNVTKVAQNGSFYWQPTPGSGWVPGGFFGATIVGSAFSGPDATSPTSLFSLVGPTSTTPVPVTTVTELYVVVPEPATLALGGLGATLITFRRKR